MMFQYIRDETRRAVSPARAGSSTVPWERKGETPLRDPIMPNFKTTLKNDQQTKHTCSLWTK